MALLAYALSILLLHVITSFAENSTKDEINKPNGWNFLQEGVTLHLIARNYDLYKNNETDCLTSKTVYKNEESRIVTQELHFRDPNTTKWREDNQTLTAYRIVGEEYNFMNTTAGAQYIFLYTNNGCGVIEVLAIQRSQSDGSTPTPTPVASRRHDSTGSTNTHQMKDAKGSNKGRRCAIWVTKDALNKTHDQCWHSFRCECDNESMYPVYNRTECKNSTATETRN
uniref:Lipocalin n=1 Tax=Rhipicephalus zambeziensis TaxID=60191 RepID=A0A224YKV2_9ACAR